MELQAVIIGNRPNSLHGKIHLKMLLLIELLSNYFYFIFVYVSIFRLYNESPVRKTVVTNDRWGTDAMCKHGGFLTCDDRFNPGNLYFRSDFSSAAQYKMKLMKFCRCFTKTKMGKCDDN